MSKWVAILLGFGLPAIAAIYVAMAPLGGAFDGFAAWLVSSLGYFGAIMGPLLLGLVIARIAVISIERGQTDPAQDAGFTYQGSDRIPAWTPSPLAADEVRDTLPSGSGAAARDEPGLVAPSPTATPAPRAEVPPPPPVILVRKPRERNRDWFGDSSWFGGLPRLGSTPWPRDANGTPLPFAAQIDLVELAFACPDTPLPRTGSLAFFLGSGAVVAVPEGSHDFSDPPSDLPPAYDEGGLPFPAAPSRLSRWFFPFWPVELLTLDLPVYLRDHRNRMRESAIEQAMATQLQRNVPLRDHPFYAAGVGAQVPGLWWHSVIHLADQLHEALDNRSRPLAIQHAAFEQKRQAFEKLRNDPATKPDVLERAVEAAEHEGEELDALEAQCAELPGMVEAVDQFIEGREPWAKLTPAEFDLVADILAEVHERFAPLVHPYVPGSLAQLATLSLRTMVWGPPEVLASLPDDVLARINADYRLPPVDQHQMFGLPATHQAGPNSSRAAHRDDILLLQLGYDDMMEWCWGETGLYQFWISEDDAAAGNWSAVKLTFESD